MQSQSTEFPLLYGGTHNPIVMGRSNARTKRSRQRPRLQMQLLVFYEGKSESDEGFSMGTAPVLHQINAHHVLCMQRTCM